MWTFTAFAAFSCMEGVNIVYKNATELMPHELYVKLRKAGIWVQLLKDIISIRAVARYGGWFIDLDICLLPRGLPTGRAYFATEACRGSHLRFAKNDCDYTDPKYARGFLNVGIFKFWKGAGFAAEAANAMESHWVKFVEDGKKNPELCARHWAWNVRCLRQVLSKHGLLNLICSPVVFMPWPIFLSKVPSVGKLHSGFFVQTWDTLLASSCTVNIWQRQWPSELQKAVLELAAVSAPVPRALLWSGTDPRPPCGVCFRVGCTSWSGAIFLPRVAHEWPHL